MKPYIHAENSVKKFGGKIEDYLAIHDFMDSSKAHVPDIRHRAIFHSSFGCYIVEKIFGVTITNSENRTVQVRDVAEQHILEDLGKIPTLQDWLSEMNIKQWMTKHEIVPQSPVTSSEREAFQRQINELKKRLDQITPPGIIKFPDDYKFPPPFPNDDHNIVMD